MDLKIISRLVRIMARGDVSLLELDDPQSGLRVKLRRGPRESASEAPIVHVVPGVGMSPAQASASGSAASAAEGVGAGGGAGGETPSGPPAGTQTFKSPMVGTFYRSSSPDADPFVSAGSRVDPDSVLCIIEAMKVMNEVKAECSGEVVQVFVENGEPVEYGQPLFLIKTA